MNCKIVRVTLVSALVIFSSFNELPSTRDFFGEYKKGKRPYLSHIWNGLFSWPDVLYSGMFGFALQLLVIITAASKVFIESHTVNGVGGAADINLTPSFCLKLKEVEWPGLGGSHVIAQWKSRLMFLIHRLVFYRLHHDVPIRIGQMVVSVVIEAQYKTWDR